MAEQEPVEKENIVELHAIEHDKIPAKEAEKSKAVSDSVPRGKNGCGQKQLIRVEVAAGIARIFGEHLRRRLERDSPDDERVDDARKHHGQHDVDDHLHTL